MADAGSSSPSRARRELGKALRGLRDQTGDTAEEVGAQIRLSGSQVTRIETGERTCSAKAFAALMDLYEVDGERRAELEDLAKLARRRQQPWWQEQYGDTVSAKYARLLEYEHDATARLDYQTVLLPPHFQTEGYARAVTAVGFAALGPDQVDALVEVRMIRQHRLNGENLLTVTAVVTQAALDFHVGGLKVHKAQLRHLLEVTRLPNVSLRVIPYEQGENGTQAGAFNILQLPGDAPDVAFAESVAGNVMLDAPLDVRRLNRLFRNLADVALDPEESRALIQRVERDLT
ncbi:helix-turn-helix domain-containing protein [Streptodolium elevatio]|uniref:Helix-turn-helix transcriptional regulator n=1 Tax=Streptodolium elevatio TaxID=3157996 RepID=A0ABV3D8U2_9ACTN